ncbi:MAG: hypothetical protein J2P28_17825 [Actinobacteria bacterium]|nr:hypothetical protein [Actinomycetota bacterium]
MAGLSEIRPGKAAEMISETLDSSIRLALLDVLSAAADEITASLDGGRIWGLPQRLVLCYCSGNSWERSQE